MIDEEMLIKADTMSDKYGKIKIITSDGRTLIGTSWGIMPARDAETGDELDYNCIAIDLANGGYEELINNDIQSVEKA